MDSGKFEVNLSVPLVLEYEEVAKRLSDQTRLSESDIEDILDYVCTNAIHRKISYLWRPLLCDAKDDMVLELAVAGECQFIVTFNHRDFAGAENFGIEVVTPKEFLQIIGELS
ncbi:MAG: PIN domain-containing protein [Acidobacteria bacterium]|nr:PIN domain-containing protein [Acidobacteriota bacterium]